jgi:outer membrane protein OmpA-like peptidoglycan-associated protein
METRRILAKIKKPFIIVSSILLLYAGASIYVLPSLLLSKIPEIIRQETGRKALISKIQVQPFPLSIKLHNFEIQEQDGQPFTTFDSFYIKFSLLQSIGRLALVFDEMALKKPFVHIARQKNGVFNFQDLLKDKADDKKKDSQPFPVNVTKLSLSEGKLAWEDTSINEPIREVIDSIDVNIENLTTYGDKQALLVLSLALESGGQLDWKGTANIKPWSSEGHIKFDKVKLKTIMALALPGTRPFNVEGYELLETDYSASYTENGLKFATNKSKVEIRDFQFLEQGQNKPLIKIPVFSLQGINVDVEKQLCVIETISANDGDFQAWLNAQGAINYQNLFPAANPQANSTNKTTANAVQPNETPWKIMVNAVELNNFGLAFEDRSIKNPVVINLKPINFKLTNYSSEPGTKVPFQLSTGLTKTGLINLAGDTVIQPFSAKIAITAKDIALKNFQTYADKYVQMEVADGKLAIDGNIIVAIPEKKPLDVQFKGNTKIANLLIRDQLLKENGQNKTLIKAPAFTLNGINFNLGNKTLALDSILANGADLQAWLNPKGVINYQTLVRISNADKISINETIANTIKPKTATWNIKVNDIALTNFSLRFEDQTLEKSAFVNFKPINLKLTNYSNQSATKLPVDLSIGMNKTGRILLKGDTVIEPLFANLDLDVKNIDLESFQPYFNKLVRLDFIDGDLHVDGKVAIAKKGQDKLDVKFNGNTSITRLLTRDQTLHKDFVKWKSLTLKDVDLDLLANRYTAAALVIDKPYARVTIEKDKTINFKDIIVSNKSKPELSAKTAPNKQSDLNKPYFKLGKIEVKNGSSDFADLSLIMPFAAQIKSLDGGATDLSSEQKSIIKVALKGNAYDLAPVDITGEISPYLGDYKVEMNFNGLPMPLVSPYMVQFAGYKVEKGKMTLGLKYHVVNKKLTASNNILIDQFELGEKVENPKAVSLPLKLAVALLKDSSGRIKIDVPITGSLDDPKFSIGTIVTDALMNALSKVVTSPFRVIGSLMGSQKDISSINFTPGYSALNDEQQEKLDALAKALKERPVLNLDIKGAAFQDQDWPIIREDALYEQLKKRRAVELNKNNDRKIRDQYVKLSDDDYKRLLAEMFIEKFPLLAEKSFLGTPQLMNPQAGDFYKIAKQKLFTIIKPEPARLKELATARAQAIANYIVIKGGIAREKVYILDTVIDPERNNKEVTVTLSLNAGD